MQAVLEGLESWRKLDFWGDQIYLASLNSLSSLFLTALLGLLSLLEERLGNSWGHFVGVGREAHKNLQRRTLKAASRSGRDCAGQACRNSPRATVGSFCLPEFTSMTICCRFLAFYVTKAILVVIQICHSRPAVCQPPLKLQVDS